MDVSLVEKIVHEVKSQGVFDEFRKDSMADVDTKPAYQNLRQRVEKSVKKFLSEQTWTPETNKNQLREKLRRHIAESGFLDVGVERIVDQVVNPKIGSVFQPRIEEIAYKYLGLPPPPKVFEPPPPPLMHPLPPLPLTAPPPPLKVETCSLLPNDLEQVSPDSDKATVKSEIEGDDKTEVDMDTEDKIIDDDESPPFEPLVKNETTEVKQEPNTLKTAAEESETNIKKYEDASSVNIKTEAKESGESQSSNNFNPTNLDKDNNSQSMDCRNSQDSQLSSVSSDTRLTPEIKDDSGPPRTSQEEAVTANISEEAQMPKFNENSSEPSFTNGRKELDSELHFDIKKDEIKFEGTERKKMDDSQVSPLNDDIKCDLPPVTPLPDNKNDMFKFSVNSSSIAEQREDDMERTPNGQESSFGSSIDDSASIPTNNTTQATQVEEKYKEVSIEDKSPKIATPKIPSTPTPTATPTATPNATPTPTPPTSQLSAATPSPISTHRTDREHSSRHSSSSSKHKKHSKERRRSHDREKDKDRYRSSKEGKDRHHSSNSSSHRGSSSKHSSSSSSNRHYSSSSHNKSTSEKDVERSHLSSRHGKYSSSSDKRHSLPSSHKDHSSSSSNTSSTMAKTSRRNDDDHYEAKHKSQRRKSTDSNDEDGDKGGNSTGGGGKSTHHQKPSSASSSKSKSKYSNDTSNSTPSKEHDTQQTDVTEHPKPNNNVVILNDLLQNPETQCIHLDTRGHLIEVPTNPTDKKLPVAESEENKSADLLYFDVDLQESLRQRINTLNDTMDLCRKAVNYLRFDSPVDEGIELSSEDDYNHNRARSSISSIRSSLKRKSTINYEDYERTPQKRCPTEKNEENSLKTSPTPSDLSVSSKENEEIDKNSALSKKLDRHKAAVEKLSQQQRYTSDDLYKPRPILGQRSRRRGMDSVM
ncbi:biorientation of chromosomes in cell division protein 1-like 1 [Musca vetustissima]|uniref:biorientation of chromosomes in cell division protein 1-like 1 n=1 Tax=Musca vetustissima TaxID=27455 RepID=UPI002AB77920|nr:biorientation of chromosomes in cell division protein 1-like 1 [Musca vetustissima]